MHIFYSNRSQFLHVFHDLVQLSWNMQTWYWSDLYFLRQINPSIFFIKFWYMMGMEPFASQLIVFLLTMVAPDNPKNNHAISGLWLANPTTIDHMTHLVFVTSRIPNPSNQSESRTTQSSSEGHRRSTTSDAHCLSSFRVVFPLLWLLLDFARLCLYRQPLRITHLLQFRFPYPPWRSFMPCQLNATVGEVSIFLVYFPIAVLASRVKVFGVSFFLHD